MNDTFDYLDKVSVAGQTDYDTSYSVEADSRATGSSRIKFDKPQEVMVESELVEILRSCRKARRAYRLASEVEND